MSLRFRSYRSSIYIEQTFTLLSSYHPHMRLRKYILKFHLIFTLLVLETNFKIQISSEQLIWLANTSELKKCRRQLNCSKFSFSFSVFKTQLLCDTKCFSEENSIEIKKTCEPMWTIDEWVWLTIFIFSWFYWCAPEIQHQKLSKSHFIVLFKRSRAQFMRLNEAFYVVIEIPLILIEFFLQHTNRHGACSL